MHNEKDMIMICVGKVCKLVNAELWKQYDKALSYSDNLDGEIGLDEFIQSQSANSDLSLPDKKTE